LLDGRPATPSPHSRGTLVYPIHRLIVTRLAVGGPVPGTGRSTGSRSRTMTPSPTKKTLKIDRRFRIHGGGEPERQRATPPSSNPEFHDRIDAGPMCPNPLADQRGTSQGRRGRPSGEKRLEAPRRPVRQVRVPPTRRRDGRCALSDGEDDVDSPLCEVMRTTSALPRVLVRGHTGPSMELHTF
jgi:hypothetical protein